MKTPTPGEARHPIRVVTERTGLSPHVLRAWERRYGAVKPARGEGGQRLYSDADIQRLTLLSKASQAGRPVGNVARLSAEELTRLVTEDADGGTARTPAAAAQRAEAMRAVRALDQDRLESGLRCALLRLGVVAFLDDVLAPLLVEIGDAWKSREIGIAHEHAASSGIERLLGWLTRELEPVGTGPRALLATPPGERHALGAMMAAALATHDGWRVTWLGVDLPVAQVAAAARIERADAVGLSLARGGLPGVRGALAALRREIPPEVPIVVGGDGAAGLRPIAGVTAARDLAHWRALLRAHAPRGERP